MNLIKYYPISNFLLEGPIKFTFHQHGDMIYDKYSDVDVIDDTSADLFVNGKHHGYKKRDNMEAVFNRGKLIRYKSDICKYKNNKLQMGTLVVEVDDNEMVIKDNGKSVDRKLKLTYEFFGNLVLFTYEDMD